MQLPFWPGILKSFCTDIAFGICILGQPNVHHKSKVKKRTGDANYNTGEVDKTGWGLGGLKR